MPNTVSTMARGNSPTSKNQRGHVLPRAPIIDLAMPGRLRTGNVLALCNFSHSTLYAKLRAQEFPEPDGSDGRNFWNTETIRTFLGAR